MRCSGRGWRKPLISVFDRRETGFCTTCRARDHGLANQEPGGGHGAGGCQGPSVGQGRGWRSIVTSGGRAGGVSRRLHLEAKRRATPISVSHEGHDHANVGVDHV